MPQLPSAPHLSDPGPRSGDGAGAGDAALSGRPAPGDPTPAWLLDSAVHELKGPAAAMLDLAGLLADDPDEPLSPRQRRQLDHLMSAGRHLLGLLDDLRGADGGLWPCHAETVDLQALASEALAFHAALAARRGLSLRLSGSPSSACAWADPRRTLQVLLNLVANAVRYCRSGATVAVCIGPGATFSVHDEGPGLDAAAVDRVFIPGERLGRADGQGQGLGLALSRALLRRMGGQLEFRSEPGHGSIVSVRLPGPPAVASEAAVSDAARPAPDGSGTGRPGDGPAHRHTAAIDGGLPAVRAPLTERTPGLLCVDANPVLAQWLDARLSAPRTATAPALASGSLPATPWRVRQTASVPEALALARTCRPTLVLVDPALPGGWELLGTWQADAQLRRIPVVVVSGVVDPRLWLRARALGVLDCWSKPLPLARLHALLAKLAGARHPSVPAPRPRPPRSTGARLTPVR